MLGNYFAPKKVDVPAGIVSAIMEQVENMVLLTCPPCPGSYDEHSFGVNYTLFDEVLPLFEAANNAVRKHSGSSRRVGVELFNPIEMQHGVGQIVLTNMAFKPGGQEDLRNPVGYGKPRFVYLTPSFVVAIRIIWSKRWRYIFLPTKQGKLYRDGSPRNRINFVKLNYA